MFEYGITKITKTESEKIRQNGAFLHTSHSALENLTEGSQVKSDLVCFRQHEMGQM